MASSHAVYVGSPLSRPQIDSDKGPLLSTYPMCFGANVRSSVGWEVALQGGSATLTGG